MDAQSLLVPLAVVVRSANVEDVVSGVEIRITGVAPGSTVHPVPVKAFQPVGVPVFLRCDEIQGGKLKGKEVLTVGQRQALGRGEAGDGAVKNPKAGDGDRGRKVLSTTWEG